MGQSTSAQSGCKIIFFFSLLSNKELWMFCVDPKYHAEDFSMFGRKESPFLSSWRLVAPWPTSCCSPVNIQKPGKVIITGLVLARKEKLLLSGV